MEEFELKQTLPSKRPLSSLESFSDDAINSLYMKLEEFQSLSFGLKIEGLLKYEENPTIKGMEDVLDSAVATRLDKEDPDSIAQSLVEGISEWNDRWKRVLKSVLLIKILKDKDLCMRIGYEILQENYYFNHIDDLAFIWLNGLMVKDIKVGEE